MVLALAFAALPLAVLLQGIRVRILRDPPAPATQVAFVPLPPPDADAPPAEPLRPAEGARPPVAPPAVLPPLPAPMPASANGEGRLFPASWAEVPSQRLLGKHNPPRARYEGVSGGALLACRVLPSRRLADCAVLRETPEGYGFGKAALEAAADFRVNPPMLDGQAVAGGRVAVPVAFRNREPRP
ncbi:TonB family protein [Nostoc ellipsosporum NOK]|nr:TonB family protein [Nostoc ellipsosporum NOK]